MAERESTTIDDILHPRERSRNELRTLDAQIAYLKRLLQAMPSEAEVAAELQQLRIERATALQVYPGEWLATLPDYDLGSMQGQGKSADAAMLDLAMQRIAERP